MAGGGVNISPPPGPPKTKHRNIPGVGHYPVSPEEVGGAAGFAGELDVAGRARERTSHVRI